jgi:hypothetical protein
LSLGFLLFLLVSALDSIPVQKTMAIS